MLVERALRFVSVVTLRDLIAGALALVCVLCIAALAAFQVTIPDTLVAIGTLAAGYVLRGVENGGLKALRKEQTK